MEKQGKRKFVDQNITEPKTLLCAARKIEETPSSAVITGKEEKTDTMGLSDQDRRNLKISLAVTESLSSNYKPVTGNDIARSAHVTAIETMFVEGNASHFFDELDCNNFASPNNLSVAYKEPVTENDIARRAHVTAIETMFVDGFARHSFDKLDCKNFASPDLLSVAYNDDHLTGYMQKGSLENHLFKRHSTPLPWTTRSKIAVANGLAFLHGPKKPVIYRDFKASNILLDSDYNAKLSDFGLAKDGLRVEDTHVSTRVMDNQMDATPEYTMTGNMFYQEGETELHQSYGNVRRHPEFQHDYTYKHSQHIRKDIVQCLSSSVVSVVVSLGIFYNIWSSQLSIFQVQSLHKEHSYRLSIWPSFLGLFGFMVFVCAVAVMNLVGAPFTSMQKAMLIFLAILMHLQSANSIIEVFVTLVGGLSMGWHAFGKKKNHQMKSC